MYTFPKPIELSDGTIWTSVLNPEDSKEHQTDYKQPKNSLPPLTPEDQQKIFQAFTDMVHDLAKTDPEYRFKSYRLTFNKAVRELSPDPVEADIRFGMFNGYPHCCIWAYACGWHSHMVYEAYPELRGHGLGYVPCHMCCENMMEES